MQKSITKDNLKLNMTREHKMNCKSSQSLYLTMLSSANCNKLQTTILYLNGPQQTVRRCPNVAMSTRSFYDTTSKFAIADSSTALKYD